MVIPLSPVDGYYTTVLARLPPAAAHKRKRCFFGDTPNPGKGLAALCNPACILIETYR
jgi:hypothetical protein